MTLLASNTHSLFDNHTSLFHSALTLILGFRRDVDEICTLLGYYAASRGNIPEEHRSHSALVCSY
jgi:hypothetical protein